LTGIAPQRTIGRQGRFGLHPSSAPRPPPMPSPHSVCLLGFSDFERRALA